MNDVVPCEICGTATTMTGTRRCDHCWHLERLIRCDPDSAEKILDKLKASKPLKTALGEALKPEL